MFKSELVKFDKSLNDITITSRVADSLNTHDKSLIEKLERTTKLKLPGIYFKQEHYKGLRDRIKDWFIVTEEIEFQKITWKKFIDITLSKNIERITLPAKYKSKYEIYLAVMKITVDKIGVDYSEIGFEKSFTDDLGVD